MAKRGRKSGEERDTRIVHSVDDWRPKPPAMLCKEAAQEWTAICRRMPRDWFGRETHGVLELMCASLVRRRQLEDALTELFDGVNLVQNMEALKGYAVLHKLVEAEGRLIISAARSLRLTKQSQIEPRSAARAAAELPPDADKRPRPWEALS